jgi:hypothetical protein
VGSVVCKVAWGRFHRVSLYQGWANVFVGGPNGKSKMSGGPTYFLLAILVNNNKPETQTRAARIAKQ